MYENKKTFESILVLIVDLCSLIVSMELPSGSVTGSFMEGLSMEIRSGCFYSQSPCMV